MKERFLCRERDIHPFASFLALQVLCRERDSNPHNHFWSRDFKSLVSTIPPSRPNAQDGCKGTLFSRNSQTFSHFFHQSVIFKSTISHRVVESILLKIALSHAPHVPPSAIVHWSCKTKVRHIRTTGRAIYREEAQTCSRYVIQL